MPHLLAVLKRIETGLCVQPTFPSTPSTGSAATAGSASISSSIRNFADVDSRPFGGIGGAGFECGELQLRDPDRILITHADCHQPRDFDEHRVIDIAPADEPPHTIHIELRVARALIIDQPIDGFADDRGSAGGQTLGEERRRVVVLTDEIGEQIAQRGK